MNQRLEIIEQVNGKKFGRLLAVEYVGPNGNGERMWKCQCECGKTKVVKGSSLRSGATKSCGCYKKECNSISRNIKHGMTKKGSPRNCYTSWVSMRTRCKNRFHKAYHRYGGRGIKICKRWDDFQNFLADMGMRPEGMELDRINNDGDYEPSNCRWATCKQQGRNRNNNRILTVGGESRCLSEWSELTGTKKTTIRERLRRRWSEKEAIYGKGKTNA